MRGSKTTSASGVAAMFAAILVLLAVSTAHAGDDGARAVTSHVLVGVSASSSFGVIVDGTSIPEGVVDSDDLGILEFAVDDGGLPPGTHTVHFSPPDSLPEPLVISDVVVDSITFSSAVIKWHTNIPSTSRVVYGLTTSYGSDTGVDPEMTTSHRMKLEGLNPEEGYHYLATSIDEFERTAESGDLVFTTDPAPLEVFGLEVSAVGPTWAIVNWSTSRPATSQVEYGLTDSYGETTSEDIQQVVEHSVMLVGLFDGTLYHFRAHSRDGVGMEATSSDSTFETLVIEPTGPPIIEDVEAQEDCVNSVNITWTTDRPATSQVLYGTKREFDLCTDADTTLVTDHFVCIRPVAPGHEYTFVVLSACGTDTSRSVASVFTAELPQGSTSDCKGVLIERSGVSCVAETTATVAWATDRPCTTWVEFGIDRDYENSNFPGPSRGWGHQCELGDLTPGTLYYYRVVAWDEFGGVVYGDEGEFLTCERADEEPPGSPGGLLGTVTDGGVLLEWSPRGEEDLRGYFVYRLPLDVRDGDDFPFDVDRAIRLNELPLANVSYLDTEIGEETQYQYSVSAIDDAGNESDLSDPVTVRLGEVLAGLQLSIYPNPVFERATLSYSAPPGAIVSARLYSADGRLVREISRTSDGSGTGALVWDGRDRRNVPVGSGVYLCEVRSGNDLVRRKLTLTR